MVALRFSHTKNVFKPSTLADSQKSSLKALVAASVGGAHVDDVRETIVKKPRGPFASARFNISPQTAQVNRRIHISLTHPLNRRCC